MSSEFTYETIKDAPPVHRTIAQWLIRGLTEEQVAEKLNCLPEKIEELLLYEPFQKHVLDTRLDIALKRTLIKSLDAVHETLEAAEGKPAKAADLPELLATLKETTNTVREVARRVPGMAEKAVRSVATQSLGESDMDNMVRGEIQQRLQAATGGMS